MSKETKVPASFVVLEGIDGAGTTTQARELRQRLAERGIACLVTAEPSSGVVGKLIRTSLGLVDDPPDPAYMALLFAADRLDHWREEISPALERGEWVISDRYLWSSLSYQSQTLPIEWVRTLNRYARPPDLTILVDTDPVKALNRISMDGRKKEIFDDLEMQNKIRRVYIELYEAEDPAKAALVDGNCDIEETAKQIWKSIETRLLKNGR